MIRLLPGPAGADSPAVDDGPLDAATWRAWLHIGEARQVGRAADVDVLIDALRLDEEPAWRFWWDRQHSTDHLTHRADVVKHPAGETLLSTCGYSQPWPGYGVGVWPMGDRPILDSRRTYCLACVDLVLDQRPQAGDRLPTDPTIPVALPA